MSKRLGIVQCGKTKIWDKDPNAGPVAARHAYTGTFAKLSVQYADLFFDRWVILSAKHGFLLPDDVVPEAYDVSFSSGKSGVIIPDALRRQLAEKGLADVQEVVLLGGQKYARVVEAVFGGQAVIHRPLAGQKGIGYMLRALKEAVERRERL
ncbi:hypothetical protein OS242_01690 [Tumebacillus sp. DT12]|uniref:DUF6884 domain-containing protein n=1 Tax=Tumebacillus lacus TaxID=2995335 RepID=A0ABT3WVH8_9BACL|nr:DUF6884 domain-containing protein [Tumebacillus lacus]MCX7568682.1 hypothetical protein [Tumebacillus lacus]